MWVKSNIIQRKMGLSIHAINKKRYRSIWVEGIHWIKARDNVIYYDIDEIQRWVYE
ncbi:excisionase family protein [Vibrio coralliirubri]|uniref:excisionase family protein n=1 Tax=Vibrio coralliirubri TaxID=1516159 RepID=UPI000F0A6D6B|nr:excisionase family protein [Vibrio coralliirubri]